MTRSALPWLLVAALLGVLLMGRCGGEPAAVARAEAAEDSLATLAPLVDSLKAEAAYRDTVLVAVTDTLRVTVERVRVETTVVLDTLYATADSSETAYLDELVALHAEEVNALEVALTETRLWGTAWRDAAQALALENEQLRIRGDEWESAYRSVRRANRWIKVGQVAVFAGGVVVGSL